MVPITISKLLLFNLAADQHFHENEQNTRLLATASAAHLVQTTTYS